MPRSSPMPSRAATPRPTRAATSRVATPPTSWPSWPAWPLVSGGRRSPPAVEGDAAPGITGVTAEVIAAAADLGLVVKLVARAQRGEDGAVGAGVVPSAVPAGSPLGRTGGVTNIVELAGEPIGRVRFGGPGP